MSQRRFLQDWMNGSREVGEDTNGLPQMGAARLRPQRIVNEALIVVVFRIESGVSAALPSHAPPRTVGALGLQRLCQHE
jgi:hypothetical protein